SLECGLSAANHLPPPGAAVACESRERQVWLVPVNWKSIRGWIASTSLPECFALQRTQTKPGSLVVTGHFRT
ncbi:hypothetical protein ATANTOWER_025185, partial [Ataeniobius toweri]|nr:hypothetical protein [Ataeniobius toweri]